jgi:hypothetical protein
MNFSTSQLLFARWYPGSGVPPAQARDELRRRGWGRLRHAAVLAMVLPCIAPDRFMRRLDAAQDDSEETGTFKEVLFSALFSAFLSSLLGSAVVAYRCVAAHDSGRPFGWGALLGWLGVAIVSGVASRLVARREA